MSTVPARPLGSSDPPPRVALPRPAFRYGLKASTCPPWDRVELRIVPQEGRGAPVSCSAKPADDWLLFEFEDLLENVRYDGILVHRGRETPLFHGAELYRLAVEDQSYRVLPPPRRG
jgi:hypothetical protein